MCVRVRAPGGSVETKGFLIGHVQTNVRDWSNGLWLLLLLLLSGRWDGLHHRHLPEYRSKEEYAVRAPPFRPPPSRRCTGRQHPAHRKVLKCRSRFHPSETSNEVDKFKIGLEVDKSKILF